MTSSGRVRVSLSGFSKVLELADLDVLDEVDDVADRAGVDPRTSAPDVSTTRKPCIRRGRRRGRRDTRCEPHPVEHRLPILEPPMLAGVDGDVGVVLENLALQSAPKPPITDVTPQSAHEPPPRRGFDKTRDHREKSALARRRVARRRNDRKLRPSAPVEESRDEPS